MKIVTCITDINNDGFAHYLKPSCSYFNLNLVTLEPTSTAWPSHRLKDYYLLQYLKELPSEELVLFTDGYDTVMLADQEEIEKKFFSQKGSILFTAELGCWPSAALEQQYKPTSYANQYLNSGGLIGRAGDLLTVLERYPSAPSHYSLYQTLYWKLTYWFTGKQHNPDKIFAWSNQYYWTCIYLHNADDIHLDYHCEIFLALFTPANALKTVYNQKLSSGMKADFEHDMYLHQEQVAIESKIILENDRIKSTATGTYPCHLHFNGPIPKRLMNTPYFQQLMPWVCHVH